MGRKRYVQVGVGSRGWMYSKAVVETYKDVAEMVGFCDTNAGRLKQRVDWAATKSATVPGYAAEDFAKMVRETKPDCVIVTTKDCHHDQYICAAMELGCDAITEKPLTTDDEKCRRIVETQRKTGKKCVVTFNYRYSPPRTQVKDVLMSGLIGEVLSVDFNWLLDTRHGADYFRRWHRNKENSGGLMVHKATHHFDIVNWWLSTVPKSVYALGDRKFYTPKTAERYGLTKRSERCLDCVEKEKCAFYLDIANNEHLRELYLDNEQYDGYFRDRCVFSDQIDIEDTMQLAVEYENGVRMSYSLNAFMPWEGYVIAFNGSKGRLEQKCQETVYISGDGSVPGELIPEGTTLKVFPHFGAPYALEVWKGEGGHGGGDERLLDDLFSPNPQPDKYLHAADYRAGAYSILVGVAANHSMRTGQAIRIGDLVPGLAHPDYPPMPSAEAPIPMGKRTACHWAGAAQWRLFAPAEAGSCSFAFCQCLWTQLLGEEERGLPDHAGAGKELLSGRDFLGAARHEELLRQARVVRPEGDEDIVGVIHIPEDRPTVQPGASAGLVVPVEQGPPARVVLHPMAYHHVEHRGAPF